MRMHVAPFRSLVESETAILDRQGLLPRAPPVLGNKTPTELFADGAIQVEVDPKYPQAIGISTVRNRAAMWGNSAWEVLQNADPSGPFFTSDYPVVLEARDALLANWIVPLAPDLAIRIIPDIRLSGTTPDPSFSQFSYCRRTPQRAELIAINVRCAEDMVFYRDNLAWIANFVGKNRHYRIEAVTERIPIGRGFLNRATRRIVGHRADTDAD